MTNEDLLMKGFEAIKDDTVRDLCKQAYESTKKLVECSQLPDWKQFKEKSGVKCFNRNDGNGINYIKGEGYMEGDMMDVMETLGWINIEKEFDDQFDSCDEV